MKKQIKLIMGLTLSTVLLLMMMLGCSDPPNASDPSNASENEKAKPEISDLLGTWQSNIYTEAMGTGELTAYAKVIITKDTFQTIEVVTASTSIITTGEKAGTLWSITKIDQQGLAVTLSIENKGITDTIALTFTDSTKTAFKMLKTYYKVP